MVKVAGCWPLTAETCVQSQARSYSKVALGRGFSQSCVFLLLASFHQCSVLIHSSSCDAMQS
jgi:hypothetical protein